MPELFRELIVGSIAHFILSFLAVLAGLLFYQGITKPKYRGWSAVLRGNGQEIDRQELGVETARRWLEDTWQRKLGLKSMCSDNDYYLKTNVLKLTTIDRKKRIFVVDFDPECDLKNS